MSEFDFKCSVRNANFVSSFWGAVHSYDIEKLAPAYFISNLALEVSPEIPEDAKLAWFPIEGGKETKRRFYVSLHGGMVERFS